MNNCPKLFKIINSVLGKNIYSIKRESDNTLNETNFLKNDKNYYAILKSDWVTISEEIEKIFNSFN